MTRANLTGPIVLAIYVIVIYAPILVLPVFSFNDSIFIAFPLRGFTTEWYGKMLENRSLLRSLGVSVQVAVSVAIVSTMAGFLAAKALAGNAFPGRRIVLAIFVTPLLLPAVIIGVSLLTMLRGGLGLDLSVWTIGAGHAMLCIPFATLTCLARLEGLDPSLEEASLDLGVGRVGTLFRVTAPLAAPAILASLLLCFTISFDEFVVSFFLAGSQTTLPLFMYSQLRFPEAFPTVLALATCILTVSAIILCSAEWLRRHERVR